MNWIKSLFLLIIAACVSAANTSARPNVIFVMADDLGYADLSCYGQKAFRTPHLDLMAAEGIRFMNAYSGSTVGAPARSTLMTGTHMGHTSVRSNVGGVPLLDEDMTVAEVLKKAGYATGGFGKWGLGDLNTSGVPEQQGFDRFYGYYHQPHTNSYYPDYLVDTGKKVPLPGNAAFRENNPGKGGLPDSYDGKTAHFAHHLIKQEMFDWIRANKDKPFFCYAPWTPPHGKFEMPASDPAWQAVKDEPWGEDAKGHAAFTIMLDRDMGELFALLKELGIDGNTVVFFCSDSGPDDRYDGVLDSCGPFRGAYPSLYEGGLRVPLLVRWPGVIKPAQATLLSTYFPDVLPTLAELAGAQYGLSEDLDGVSLVPTLLNRPDLQLIHGYLYWEWTRMNSTEEEALAQEDTAQAVRIGKWKGLRDRMDAEIELYDLFSDPGETNNLAATKPDLITEITRVFNDVRTEVRPQAESKTPAGQGTP